MKRITQLDGIRGIAIMLVLVWHYFNCQIIAAPNSVDWYLFRALRLTWSGVDLFFVLSGFLIAGILIDNRFSLNYFRVFYLRRICRIFPLYFFLLAIFVACQKCVYFEGPTYSWIFKDPFPIWTYAAFVQNISMGLRGDFGAHWLAVSWSLAVEEQFYLFVPLIIYYFTRKQAFAIMICAIVLAVGLRFYSPGFHAYVNTPWRSDSLASGACIAILVRSPMFVSVIKTNYKALKILFGVLTVSVLVLTLKPSIIGAFDHLLLAGLFSILILLAFCGAEDSLLIRFLRIPLLTWIGQVSYGVYMFHEAVSGLLHGMIRHHPPQIQTQADAAVTLLGLIVTFLLAAISFRYFESPIVRFGHRYKYLMAK